MKVALSLFLIFYCVPALTFTSSKIEITTTTEKKINSKNNRHFYSFGRQQIYQSQWAYFSLRNKGTSPVYLRGVFISGASFDAWTNCPHWLKPDQRCLTSVEFQPMFIGYFSGRLRYAFSYDSTYVDLDGWGVEW